MNPFDRTRLLLGEEAMEKLKNAKVAVFGLGGVGGYVVEALARCGIGALELVDHDTISITNINRQILATRSTVGKSKALAAKERVLDIDPIFRSRNGKCSSDRIPWASLIFPAIATWWMPLIR